MRCHRSTSSSTVVCCRPVWTPKVVIWLPCKNPRMPRTAANGIEIEYDTFGSKDDPTLLLIMGLGAQLIAWEEGFCRLIADRGFHVVRFDNRDVGLSTKIEDAPPIDLPAALDRKSVV